MGIAAVVLAYVLIAASSAIPSALVSKWNWLYSGGPEGARSVLSTIAGSVVTVAGTTFSITIAALTLASSQFGPRLLRTFRRDTGNQIVLGTFIATILYCLLVLRTIVGTDQYHYVPSAAVTFGVLLAILSLGVLIYFIHHTAASIQVARVMESVGKELNGIIEDIFPEGNEQSGMSAEKRDATAAGEGTIPTERSGYLLRVDYEGLRSFATKHKLCLYLHLHPGDYSLPDTPLLTVTPTWEPDEKKAQHLRNSFSFGAHRTPEQDPEHAIIQLAEIGVRALSPGINGPFTAMDCIDQLTQSMAFLAGRRISSQLLRDKEGEVRVVKRPLSYEQLVFAAYQYIRRAAEGNREVLAHLVGRLELLLGRVCEADFHSSVQRQLELARADLQRCPL